MRRTPRGQSTSFAAFCVAALTLAACAQSQDSSPGGPPAPAASGATTDASAPVAPGEEGPGDGASGAYADTIVVALGGEVGFMSNAADDAQTEQVTALLYAGLYVADASLAPVPNLAADFCAVSEDDLAWTCTLREGLKFHDGQPITAGDVAYTYQLGMSEHCRYAPIVCSRVRPVIASVAALDDATVVFGLVRPHAPFALDGLASIGIESKAVIEAAYGEFQRASQAVSVEGLNERSAQLSAAITAGDQAACNRLIEAADGTVIGLGGAIPRRASHEVAGAFDACAYIGAVRALIASAATSMSLEGTDAVAASYPLLGFNTEPVGSGPYVLETFDPGYGVTLSAFPDWWDGEAATASFDMPIVTNPEVAAQALAAGELDWVSDVSSASRDSLGSAVAVTLLEYNGGGKFALLYQLHPSIELSDGTRWQGLFFDRALRKAVQHCIDKAALVGAATGGTGVAIETEVPAASWAFNPELEVIERDVDAAIGFIEDEATVHTWTRGADGIFVNENGARLSVAVQVRSGQMDRIDFMNALAAQVEDCGIEIVVEPQDFQTVLRPALVWPHVAPGQSSPWHAYFSGFGDAVDPDPSAMLHGSQCSGPDRPDGSNFICFQNAELDRLIEAGLRETDTDARAEIYRQYQALIHEEQPYLIAWSYLRADAVDANLAYVDGELPLGTPNWDWQPHRLVLREAGP